MLLLLRCVYYSTVFDLCKRFLPALLRVKSTTAIAVVAVEKGHAQNRNDCQHDGEFNEGKSELLFHVCTLAQFDTVFGISLIAVFPPVAPIATRSRTIGFATDTGIPTLIVEFKCLFCCLHLSSLCHEFKSLS
jgi:hypothetical protein